MAKIAVVTGAAGGLGRSISHALVRDGHFVIGLDIDERGLAKLSDMIGPDFQRFPIDLSEPAEIETVFRRIGDEHGGLDTLVNKPTSLGTDPSTSPMCHLPTPCVV